MDPIKVFFIEPTDREHRFLRRFSLRDDSRCTGDRLYCNAMFDFGEGPNGEDWAKHAPLREDPRWPVKCDHCSKAFDSRDEYQAFDRTIYECKSTGWRGMINDAPVGACWNASWIVERRDGKQGSGHIVGPDGRCLILRVPGNHDWMIDSRCTNCTRPDDDEHFCWVRHGRPEDGTLHVDKNGNTCSAGAGSIQTGDWHGFCYNGYLHT